MKNHNLSRMKYLQFHLIQLSFIVLLSCQVSSLNGQCFNSVTFDTPGEFNYTIPTGSVSYIIEIEARGGDGGDFLWGTNPQTNGGQGATMKASFLVPASSELLIQIGESGFDGAGDSSGGGGGGGSAVIIDNSEVLIAAAAGGGGGQGDPGRGGLASSNSPAQGGAAPGASGGGGFNESGENGDTGTGGAAGNLFNIGSAGIGGATAGSGGVGFGGGGGGSGFSGGGGGGYKGGDGSMSGDLGGFGGDSYINSLFSGSLILANPGSDDAGNNIDGFVTVTCIPVTAVNLALVNNTSPLCFDGFDGFIEVMATDGLAPYMYSLNGGILGNENIFEGLSAGDYVVKVVDGLGNSSTVTVTLDNPPALINTFLESTDNLCFGAFEGSIEVLGSGGTAASGYSYSINGGAMQPNGLFTGLPSGFYVVSVFDDNLCSTQVTANINSPTEVSVTVTSIQSVSCPGSDDGAVLVFVMGGVPNYTYAIDDEDFDVFASFSSLSSGIHIVSVKDSNECVTMTSFSIPELDPIQILAETVDVNCAGDSTGVISVNAIGGNLGYKFSFEGQQEDTIGIYGNLIAGAYNIQVTDVNGCSASLDVVVNESAPLDLISITNTPAACGGQGEIIFDLVGAQGPAVYSVDGIVGPSDTFQLSEGIYTGMAFDSLGCVASLQFEIIQLSNISIGVENQINVSCYGGENGSLTVSSEGGEGDVLFSLDGGVAVASTVFDSLSGGDYTIVATDSVGCMSSMIVTILEPEPLSIGILSVLDVACFGDETGMISFDITGGVTPYDVTTFDNDIISGDSTFSINNTGEGDLIISVVDSLGCILDNTVTVDENPPLQLTIDSVASVNCAEGTMGFVSLSAIGGASAYNFELGGVQSGGSFGGLMADIYEVEVMDSLGCNMFIDVNIGMVGTLIISGTEFSNVSCFEGDDGQYNLNIPNYIGTIDWFINGELNPDSNFINLSAGQYTLAATDSFDCNVEVVVEIDQPDELSGKVLSFDAGDGANGTITVLAEGGTEPYLYSIDDKITFQDSATFVDLIPGDYIVIIVDANGCEVIVEQIISDVINPVFESLIISPNPAFNVLTITKKNGGVKQMKVSIMDINGRIVNTSAPNYTQQSTIVDIHDLPSGTYFLRINDGEDFIVKRFVKL